MNTQTVKITLVLANQNIVQSESCYPKLNRKLSYLKTGEYLPWKDEHGGCRIYFRPKTDEVVALAVKEDVFEKIRIFEGKSKYSDRKFRNNTVSFSDATGLSKKEPENRKALSVLIDERSPIPGADDAFNDMLDVIAKMSCKNKAIVMMKFEGYSDTEISEELGISRVSINKKLRDVMAVFDKIR